MKPYAGQWLMGIGISSTHKIKWYIKFALQLAMHRDKNNQCGVIHSMTISLNDVVINKNGEYNFY